MEASIAAHPDSIRLEEVQAIRQELLKKSWRITGRLLKERLQQLQWSVNPDPDQQKEIETIQDELSRIKAAAPDFAGRLAEIGAEYERLKKESEELRHRTDFLPDSLRLDLVKGVQDAVENEREKRASRVTIKRLLKERGPLDEIGKELMRKPGIDDAEINDEDGD